MVAIVAIVAVVAVVAVVALVADSVLLSQFSSNSCPMKGSNTPQRFEG